MPDHHDRAALRVAGIDLAGVVERLAAAAPAADAAYAFPWEGVQAVHDAGLLELSVASRYGGRDIGVGELVRIVAALGRGDPSVALISLMTLNTHRNQAQRGNWPEALYLRVLAEAKEKPILLNAARGEPELGSPARGGLPQTRARRTARGWSISGRKRFVTGSQGLSYFLVWASTDEQPQRVGTFVVPAGAPGIRVIENWKSLGMRASASHDVEFNEVEVGRDDVIGLTGTDIAEQDNRAHAQGALILTAIYLGVAEAAQEAFLAFAEGRVPTNLGFPISRTERFVALAGEIDLLVGGARQLILDAVDHAADEPERLMRARLLAGRQLLRATQIAMTALGNPGLSADGSLERHFRDIQSVLVHAPQEDTVVSLLGRAAFSARAGASAAAERNGREPIAGVPGGIEIAGSRQASLSPQQALVSPKQALLSPKQDAPQTVRVSS
ncbi:acyl-CoA dehydrogenase family protein [Bosea sp. 685]|uniref:acyl-CoA dehydrogenase family protein n=1 Tax=Bosea sp. 685 TaxID=3080057 RepID=UPI002892BC4B|nr:acyl-CoA dehydrogenase family protein [Bosea sp. 685]WNJ93827.1 acyl-CoA dehydrogenase family protein [Bosea sp. 685]